MNTKKFWGAGVKIIALIFILVLVFSCGAETEEEKAARLAQEAENKEKGFHCLSSWDGSHPQFKDHVKAMLNDPDSFEHDETKVSRANEDGMHFIHMKFRARNSFGGIVRSMATGKYEHENCETVVVDNIGAQ